MIRVLIWTQAAFAAIVVLTGRGWLGPVEFLLEILLTLIVLATPVIPLLVLGISMYGVAHQTVRWWTLFLAGTATIGLAFLTIHAVLPMVQ